MATKIDSPEQELAVLKTKFQKLLGMLKQVTAENETLRNQINIEEKKNQNEDNNNDENENNENFDPIQAQNLKLIEENANLVQENTKNVSENAKLKDILFKLKQKHLENTDQITTLKEENGQFRLKIAQLESSIQDSEGSIRRNNDTSAEITTLTNQLNTSQASIDALLKEKRQLTDNVAELERQMGELNEKIEEERQEKDEQIAENELKLRNLSEELSQTKSSLQTSQTQVTSLQKLNIEQQGQLAQFESTIVQLETKIDNVNTSNRTTETVATELHAALSQNNSLTKANDALKKLQEKVERDHQDEIWLLNQTHLGEIEARQNQMVMELNERDIIIQNLNEQCQLDGGKYQGLVNTFQEYKINMKKKIDEKNTQINHLNDRLTISDDNLNNIVIQHEHDVQRLSLEQQELVGNLKKAHFDEISLIKNALDKLSMEFELYRHNNGNQNGNNSDISSGIEDFTDNDGDGQQNQQNQQNNHKNNQHTQNFHPQNKPSHYSNNSLSITEITALASTQRDRDVLQSTHQNELKTLFNYINKLRTMITKYKEYIEFLSIQCGLLITSQQRQNGVDLDYLKNVILRFILFQKMGLSLQRDAMVPVLAQLLHFSKQDFKLLESGSGGGDNNNNNGQNNNSWFSWGGNSSGGGGGSGYLHTISSPHAHGNGMNSDYDPMSSIQAQSVPINQQLGIQPRRPVLMRDIQRGQGSSNNVGDNFDNNNFNSNSNVNFKDEKSNQKNNQISSQFVKMGSNMGANGTISNIKDLLPPDSNFEFDVPYDVGRLGYLE
jgi:uncharacterized membrane protein YgcG